MSDRPVYVVVGGGIAGLTAAHVLAADPRVEVVLLESSPEVGGQLRAAEVAGITVDVGAEAMLARRPEGVRLAEDLGFPIVHPATSRSMVWSRGALRPLPRSLMGVPMDLAELAASGVLSEEGLARVRAEPSLPPTPPPDDVSVGDLVAARLGDEVVERLVEPLLGGVYAGRSRAISARAAVPQLVAMTERGSLLEQAAKLPVADGPVFAGIEGGLHRLAQALAASGRFGVRTGTTVRELVSTSSTSGDFGGFRLTLGAAHDPEYLYADAVVLATPAAPTARLLRDLAPTAAAELAGIEAASTAVVTMAFRAGDVPEDQSSGFLVPPVEQRAIKASTFSFAKWGWVRAAGRAGGDDLLVLRTSIGRHGEETSLQVTDEELVAGSLTDLADIAGVCARPVDTHVQRWGGGLPQYAVGHLDRVARIRADIDHFNAAATRDVGRLALCGASYDGVGIPAVIASARAAAAEVAPAQ